MLKTIVLSKGLIGALILLLLETTSWAQGEDLQMAALERDSVIHLSGLTKGKYLSYETMDVIFYLPYIEEVEALLQHPGEQGIFPEEPSDWDWLKWPAYMAEWTHVKSMMQEIDHIKTTDFPSFGHVVYMILPVFLEQGKVVIYDKSAGDFLQTLHWENYSMDYTCDCYGEEIRGTTHHNRFYAKTAQTAFLYFYMQQNKMRPTCCMEEFPMPEATEVE